MSKQLCFIIFFIFITCNIFASTDSVIVTAERLKSDIKEISQSITIMDEEEIKSYGSQTVAELFKQLNIGHIHSYPGFNTSIAIRGFRSDTHGVDLRGHILILVDGRRAGTGNLSKLLTKNIERIEIINGPAGIQYGSAAMGGVINIITKRGTDKGNIYIEQGAGDFGFLETTLAGSGKLKNLDFSFSGTESTSDDYKTSDGKYENTGFGLNNLNLNIGYTFSKKHRIGLNIKNFNGYDIGLTNQYEFTKLYIDDKAEKTLKSFDVDYEGNYNLGQIKLKYYQGQDKNTFYDENKNNYFGSPKESKYKTDFEGAQLTLSAKKSFFKAIAGVDYNRYKTENRNSDSVSPYSPDSTYKNIGFFLIPKLSFYNDKLVINAGIRYDDFNLKIKDTPGRNDIYTKDEDFNNTIYSAGIVYNHTENLKIRANYGEAFIVPQADQMNADYSGWGTPYKGNPNLDPESSKTYEGGFDYKNKTGLNLTLTYFYTKYKDKIETVFIDSYYTWENVGKATISGIEFNAKFDLGEYLEKSYILSPYINLVYLDDYQDEDKDDKLLYTSRLQASYGIYFAHFEYGTSIRLNFAYTSEQNVMYYNPANWSSEKKKLDSFTVTTLSVKQKIYSNKKFGNIYLSGIIDNLFDEKYEYVMGYPMPERNYKIFAKYEYEF
jgi:vitamin B12 transporter